MKSFTRIGLIGDIHAEDIILNKIVEKLNNSCVDKILCTGDIADGFGNVNKCCEIIERNDIVVVSGNHDRWLLNNEMRNLNDSSSLKELTYTSKQLISNLPKVYNFKLGCLKSIVCHGVGENDMSKIAEDDYGYALYVNDELQELIRKEYRIIINGHSHKRMVKFVNSVCIINAGTLRKDHTPCYSIIDSNLGEVEFFYLDKDGNKECSETFRINI